MTKHTKAYMEYFGYKPGDFIACEICGNAAVDIHHIRARGMGGTKNAHINDIENLMALCRRCHDFYGDNKHHRAFLTELHLLKVKRAKRLNRD